MSKETLKVGHVIEVRGASIVGELEATVDDLHLNFAVPLYAFFQLCTAVGC